MGNASEQAQQQQEEEQAEEQMGKDGEAEKLERELLSQPELKDADKLKVLRAKLKRTQASLKSNPQVSLHDLSRPVRCFPCLSFLSRALQGTVWQL